MINNYKDKYKKKSKNRSVLLEWSNYNKQLDDKASESKGKAKVVN